MMLIACVGCVPLGTHAFWEGRQLRAWLCHTPYTWFEIPYGCINFSLISLYIEMQEKVIQNYALYCVGWVDKPNISDGLRACWVFNPTSPLCHFFMHSTIYRQGR